jgi:hypothetical protein
MQNNKLSFISDHDLKLHIKNTVLKYSGALKGIDLKKFNQNLIDPIKLTFDQIVFGKTTEEVIEDEILRQRDKTSSNLIGYFHQNIFQYIYGCEVPKEGYDIIFSDSNFDWFIELKNKHNTMNSSSASSTYLRMQNTVNQDIRNCCALVEVIPKKSQNEKWITTIKKVKIQHDRIRRISIDKFYEIVTGEVDAFLNLCKILPSMISEVVSENKGIITEKDTVIIELKRRNENLLQELYKITYSDIWK